MKTEFEWVECNEHLPPNGIIVDTKVDDLEGIRNEQKLKRINSLWFHPDVKMYVYYTPTHWRPLNPNA